MPAQSKQVKKKKNLTEEQVKGKDCISVSQNRILVTVLTYSLETWTLVYKDYKHEN